MDYDHKDYECPKCHFKNDVDYARYCRKCGTELGNFCSDQQCDFFKDYELPPDSLFCHECQSKSTYYEFLKTDEN